jgi:hypothetical protein
LYCSSNVIQVKKSRMRWVDMWHAWGKSYTYRVLVEKPEGQRPHGGPGHRWMLKWILKK